MLCNDIYVAFIQVSGPGRGWDPRSGMPNLELPYFGKANDELDNEDVGKFYFSPNGRGASGRGGPGGGFSAGNGLTNPYDELDNEDVGFRDKNKGHWGFSGNPRGSGGFAGNGVTNPIQVRL